MTNEELREEVRRIQTFCRKQKQKFEKRKGAGLAVKAELAKEILGSFRSESQRLSSAVKANQHACEERLDTDEIMESAAIVEAATGIVDEMVEFIRAMAQEISIGFLLIVPEKPGDRRYVN